MVGDQDLEQAIHAKFREYRVRGEWFERRGELDAWITRTADRVARQMAAILE